MTIHPCADGLTKECFRAYPAWARKAFAYKLLHILLPKQLTKNLPFGLNLPFIPPDVLLPPGVIFPPGTIIPPDVSFPPGWTPGDPTPEGVIIPPDVSPTPPESGPTPPLYVQPWEPGPVHRYGVFSPEHFDIGSLLVEQAVTTTSINLGNTTIWSDLAMAIMTWMHAEIRAIDIKVGKFLSPDGYIHLEIWRAGTNYIPIVIAGGGTSQTKTVASLPQFTVGQDYIRFLFPLKPILYVENRYDVVAVSTNTPDGINYLKVGRTTYPTQTCYFKLPDGTWYSQSSGYFNFRIWGFAL